MTTYIFSKGRRSESLHRLVAFAFFGPPPSRCHTHVNHKDGNKSNNAASNLEYVTPAENAAHYWKSGTAAQREGKCRSNSKPVWSRTYNSDEEWTWHPSMQGAARMLGLYSASISKCVRGMLHQTGGYEFRAAEAFQSLPGEEWRTVNVAPLAEEKQERMQAAWTTRACALSSKPL